MTVLTNEMKTAVCDLVLVNHDDSRGFVSQGRAEV